MRKGQRSDSIMYFVICGTNEYIDPLVFFVSLELCSVLGYSLKILHSLSIDEQKCSFFKLTAEQVLSLVKHSPMNDQLAVCALYGTDCNLSTFVGINKRYEDKKLRSHSLF